MLFFLLVFQLLFSALAQPVNRVVIVSVDGLRSDGLQQVLDSGAPGFSSLWGDAATLDARADPDLTLTLPNHTGMFTGRTLGGPEGHGWRRNTVTTRAVLHDSEAGYLVSVFDVVHDHGLRTSLLTGKDKFVLFERSWNAENGAPDRVGEDDGSAKLDLYLRSGDMSALTDAALEALKTGPGVVVLHLAAPDLAGHSRGWDVRPDSAYLQAVVTVDVELQRLLDGIRESEELYRSTVVVLTADHGGGKPTHGHYDPTAEVNYRIPLMAWYHDHGRGIDLYAHNPDRSPQVSTPHGGSDGHPPIRNLDVGNLALSLLGLPSIPGSTVNADQDLRVLPARADLGLDESELSERLELIQQALETGSSSVVASMLSEAWLQPGASHSARLYSLQAEAHWISGDAEAVHRTLLEAAQAQLEADSGWRGGLDEEWDGELERHRVRLVQGFGWLQLEPPRTGGHVWPVCGPERLDSDEYSRFLEVIPWTGCRSKLVESGTYLVPAGLWACGESHINLQIQGDVDLSSWSVGIRALAPGPRAACSVVNDTRQ